MPQISDNGCIFVDMFQLISNNPFRVLGVCANATTSAISGGAMRLTAAVRKGMTLDLPFALENYCGAVERTVDRISAARMDLQRPVDRLESGLFWFTRTDETDSKALDALSKKDIATAEGLWRAETGSVSAQHNLAVLLLAEGRYDEAETVAIGLIDKSSRELCALISPNIALTAKELTETYKRLAPVPTPVHHEHISEVRTAPKPRKPRPATGKAIESHVVEKTAEKPKPEEAIAEVRTPEEIIVKKTEEEEKKNASTVVEDAGAADPKTGPAVVGKPEQQPDTSFKTFKPSKVKDDYSAGIKTGTVADGSSSSVTRETTDISKDADYLSGCLERLNRANDMTEVMNVMNDIDDGMSRLRNSLESRDPNAYRSWADGVATQLMRKMLTLGPYPSGHPKTEQAMSMLARARTWGLSPSCLTELNNYWTKLRSGSSNTNTIIIIILVVIGIFILNAFLSY